MDGWMDGVCECMCVSLVPLSFFTWVSVWECGKWLDRSQLADTFSYSLHYYADVIPELFINQAHIYIGSEQGVKRWCCG